MSVNIFARWASEEECLQEMLGLHDEESALAIVAGIRQRVSSDTLFKSLEGDLRVISKVDDDEIIVVGPCSWEKVDPENDLITAGAMSKFFKKWFTVVPERYRNVMLMHKSFQAGVPLLKYQGSDGQMYHTHVHEKGAMLITKVRSDDGLVQTQDLRRKVREGVYKSYSIGGMPTETEKKMQGERLVTIIKDIDPGEVTICVTGMNDMAKFEVVKADDLTEAQRKLLSYMPYFTSDDFIDMTEKEWLAFLQKPFAEWRDMDHCIRSVSSRKKPPKDPAAYCASIMHQVEGAKKALDETLKGLTPEEIDSKMERILADKLPTEEKVRDLDAVLEKVFEPFFETVWEKLDDMEVTIPESSVQPQDLKKVMREVFDESMVNLETQIRERIDKITVEAAERTPPQDLKKMVDDLFNESMDVLEARVKERIKSSESKLKSRDEVSKVMDERTLETFLKVREIFKELEYVE